MVLFWLKQKQRFPYFAQKKNLDAKAGSENPHGFYLGLRISRWGVPKIRGTILKVLVIRIMVFGGLHWGTLISGTTK